jgi:membrane protein
MAWDIVHPNAARQEAILSERFRRALRWFFVEKDLGERKQPDHRGARTIVRNVWRESVTDRNMLAAGGLAFFAMFALLPAIAAVGAIYGLLVDKGRIEAQLAQLDDALPSYMVDTLREFVTTVPMGLGLGIGLAVNLLIVLWTVQRSSSGIITALNIVHDVKEDRGRWKREGAALAIAGGSLLFLFLSLFLVAVLPLLGGEGQSPPGALMLLRWPLLALLFFLWLGAIYRIAPAEPPHHFRWISIGSAVALLLWLAASALFSLYVSHFDGFGPYYGSASAAVVLMSWLFITAFVITIGAEVNEQLVEREEVTTKEGLKEKLDRE